MLTRNSGKFLPIIIALLILQFGVIRLNAEDSQVYSLSGTVTASDNGNSLTASLVVFTATTPDGTDYVPTYKLITDENGNYTVQLKSGNNYKLEAYPWNSDYNSAFYGNTPNLGEATVLVLNGDISGANISLTKKQVYDNGIRGVVRNENGDPVSAKISVMSLSGNSSNYSTSTEINDGTFSVNNLVPGEYLLFAMPVNMGLSEGFYISNGIATADKSQASVITVDESGINSSEYTLILPAKVVSEVFHGVTGIVLDGKNQTVAKAQISIIDAFGTQIASAESDGKGIFSININVSGKFQLTAVKDGYDNGFAGFYLDEKNPNQSLNVILTPKETMSYNNGIKGIVRSTDGTPLWSQVTAYKIETDEKNGVYYSAGKTVSTSKENSGTFNLTNLLPGNYILLAQPSTVVSGYYKENADAVTLMDQATVITVNEEGTNADDYVITLENTPIQPAKFEFSGMVSTTDNQQLEGVVIKVSNEKGTDLLFDEQITTNADGMFKFSATAGSYTITANKAGFVSKSIPVSTYEKNANLYKLNITLETEVTNQAGNSNQSEKLNDINDNTILNGNFQIYPNPASDNLVIKLPNHEGNYELIISDINGTAVLRNISSGDNSQITLNVSGLSVGTYFVNVLGAGKEIKLGKFIKE